MDFSATLNEFIIQSIMDNNLVWYNLVQFFVLLKHSVEGTS